MASQPPSPPSAPTAESVEDPAGRGDPGTRGNLVVHDRVVERLAARAALNTPGVLAHSGGLDKLTGRDLPRVRVQVAGGRVRAGLDVAVAWPLSLPTVTSAVQRNVTDALTAWAGLRVDVVDVSVHTVVADVSDRHPERRVQ